MQPTDALVKAIHTAWDSIVSVYPLASSHIFHPLSGMENISFLKALNDDLLDRVSGNTYADMIFVNKHTISWCSLFFDRTKHSLSSSPHHEQFLKGFATFIEHTLQDSAIIKTALEIMQKSQMDSLKIIENSLEILQIRPQVRRAEFVKILKQLPGWSGYIRLEALKNKNIEQEYLAMRLCLKAAASHCFHPTDKKLIKQNVQDRVTDSYTKLLENQTHYQDQLMSVLKKTPQINQEKSPSIQIIFCIDPRSDRVRKRLEAGLTVQTQSMPGCFGLSSVLARYNEISSFNRLGHDSHGALEEDRSVAKKESQFSLKKILKTFSEVFFNKNTQAGHSAHEIVSSDWNQPVGLDIEQQRLNSAIGDDASEIALSMKKILQISGLTPIADKIVFCGHKSTEVSKEMIQCGACGGHHGIDHAQLAASLFNHPLMRKELGLLGILISDKTRFFAMEHDTKTDQLSVQRSFGSTSLDVEELQKEINLLSPPVVKTSTQEWIEAYPELGLANNASLIIGPRSMTKHIDFEGRAFIQSYDYSTDQDNAILEHIVGKIIPVSVALNANYILSNLFHPYYGSLNKNISNINGGQWSVESDVDYLNEGYSHKPLLQEKLHSHNSMLLTVAIYAPMSQVKKALDLDPLLSNMVKNQWVSLLVVDPANNFHVNIYKEMHVCAEQSVEKMQKS
jgi:uncharacterized protein YbcC (UPF0753/DUF2309 family)